MQIKAWVDSGGKSLSQHSQLGRKANIVFPFLGIFYRNITLDSQFLTKISAIKAGVESYFYQPCWQNVLLLSHK